jgi:DNA-binding transcriptional regulator YiaG
MSKLTQRPRRSVKRERKTIDRKRLSPRVREMVEEVHKLCDAIDGGMSLDEAARVRTTSIELKPPVIGPEDVRAVRESLGLSQAMFADYLGVGLSTVRRWEQGQVILPGVARRFLGDVRDDPSYWRKKLCR